ncbi:translation initiation factor IF-2 [Candidatus Woesearchaeota archaeon]|nr:translation initiation factor IF-2 [Candidatus Woesearchaeota archaeon]
MPLRQVVVSFVGHVDHGKSSILDKIRDTAIVSSEAGGITQAIGASIIPLQTIKKICGQLLKTLNMEIKIPGILAIDTPGHAAFTNLRKRGGNLADIAILVIDIHEGIKPQTLECIEILKQYKTPFLIALNKIDLLSGWQHHEGILLETIKKQSANIQQLLDKKIYELVGKLSELGFNSERFDRIEDYTKQIAIIPTSAKTGQGIPELLMSLTGLAQKFLEQCLECNIKGPAKGTVLEIKEEKGLGKTIDVIIYDGTLKKNDIVVIGTLDEPIVTKVKALLEPAPLAEMRDKKSKFRQVKEVFAATGVKISAPELENAVAGMPLRCCKKEEIEKIKEEIKKEISEVLIETEKEGIILKADSLGSLEALIKLSKEKNIPIRKATIGNISKKDLSDAESICKKDPLKAAVLGFNVKDDSKTCIENVKVITSDIIYKLIEDFEKWREGEIKKQQGKALELLVRPCKMQIMRGYIFRQNNPAVVGVDILSGTLKANTPLMNQNGNELTEAKSIQLEQKNIDKAEKGKQVAVSLPNVTVGRQINEGDILYSAVPEEDFRKLKDLKDQLSQEEIAILKEIAEIKRKDNVVWGI